MGFAAKSSFGRKSLEAGEILFREGETEGDCYIIESGQVELLKSTGKGDIIVGVLNKGAIVGEIALIDGEPRSATARAVEPTRLMIVPASAFQQRLDALDPVFKRILVHQSGLIRRLSTEVAKKPEPEAISRVPVSMRISPKLASRIRAA